MISYQAKVLIVEDEEAIRDMLLYTLIKAKYQCEFAVDVHEARQLVAEARPSLILMDWMLSNGVSGLDYVGELRNCPDTENIPIIMLTAKSNENDIVAGLQHGVDDYITKPFSPRELIARIEALLRRYTEDFEVVSMGGIQIDFKTHRVFEAQQHQNIPMSITEFNLLSFFMQHAERVYSRHQLLEQVWKDRSCVEERTVDVHIGRLRSILKPFGFDNYVQTVRSVGYRFSVKA